MTAIGIRTLRVAPHRATVPSFLMALAMHAALIGAMWFAMQWRTSATAPASAELWELPPTPDVMTPPPEPTPAPPVAPQPTPHEEATPPKADIVLKRQTRHAPEPPPPPPEHPPKEQKPKPTVKAPSAAELRRQQAEADKRHQEEMRRLTSQASVTAPVPMVASAGPLSNEWSARIRAAVLAHLNFAVPEGVDSSVYAEFQVELLPTGEQAAQPQLIKPSGLPGFDEAALRAILRTDPFPRKSDGSVDRTVRLRLRPQDVR